LKFPEPPVNEEDNDNDEEGKETEDNLDSDSKSSQSQTTKHGIKSEQLSLFPDEDN
jgi:hypothetical protein